MLYLLKGEFKLDYLHKKDKWLTRKIYTFCLVVILCLPFPIASALEVIVNRSVAEQHLDKDIDLRAIFSLRTRYWADGELIHIYVLPDNHPIHQAFVKHQLHMFPYQLRRTWNRVIYTGSGQAPTTVASIKEMLEKVKTTKNAIGYIDKDPKDESIYLFKNQ